MKSLISRKKRLPYTSKLCAFLIGLALSGCIKEAEGNGSFKTAPDATESFFSGDWRVNLYEVNGEDRRNGHFSEFFNFGPDHTIDVTRVTTRIIGGRWWVTTSPFSDGNPPRDLAISFRFQPVFDLELLNGDWAILERSRKHLYLLRSQDGVVTYLGLHKVK